MYSIVFYSNQFFNWPNQACYLYMHKMSVKMSPLYLRTYGLASGLLQFMLSQKNSSQQQFILHQSITVQSHKIKLKSDKVKVPGIFRQRCQIVVIKMSWQCSKVFTIWWGRKFSLHRVKSGLQHKPMVMTLFCRGEKNMHQRHWSFFHRTKEKAGVWFWLISTENITMTPHEKSNNHHTAYCCGSSG